MMAGSQRKRPRNRKQRRFAYVLARPLTIADRLHLSFVSEGKLPLCHWGMLVTNMNQGELAEKLRKVYNEQQWSLAPLGTMFELVANNSDNSVSMNQLFGSWELHTDWQCLSFVYV